MRGGRGLEILTAAEIAEADRAAIEAGTPGATLMERAGAAVVGAICGRFTPRPALVLCGPGNNGGDGYVVARLLQERGWTVGVLQAGAPRTADAKAMAAQWRGPCQPLTGEPAKAELLIDALFGVGLSKPLEGAAAAWARRRGAPVVSIDVPSGLSSDTGKAIGPDAFHAALTVTFHRKKPVHVLEPGRSYCGEVAVADIGLGETPSSLHENLPELWRAKMHWPGVATHKHSRGRLVMVSGGPWSTGAARLAARGGLRIGAGFVTLLSPVESLAANAAHLEAIVLKPFDGIAQWRNRPRPPMRR